MFPDVGFSGGGGTSAALVGAIAVESHGQPFHNPVREGLTTNRELLTLPLRRTSIDLVGMFARMARSGDRGDLLAAGLGPRPVREQFASETSEDATWVAAARDGDRLAFGQLYERYFRMVHGVLLAKVPVGEVDDLVQDVFIRALRRLSTLRETASIGAWLAAIARNVASDYHRRDWTHSRLSGTVRD